MQNLPQAVLIATLTALLGASAIAARPPRGALPDSFMLYFCAPGVDPGEPGDDQGPPRQVRRRFTELTGCNVGEFAIAWGDTEREEPGDGPSRYDFSRVRPPKHVLQQEHIICHLIHFGNRWAGKFRFTDVSRYNELLRRWASATSLTYSPTRTLSGWCGRSR